LLRRDPMKAHYGEGFLAGYSGDRSPTESLHAEGGADGAARETGYVGGAGFVRAGTDCCGVSGSRVRARSPDPPTSAARRRPQGRKSQGSGRRGSAGGPKE
jgi:hypothetical protein